MPVINFELSDADTERLDAIAKQQLRARKYAVAVLVMERISEVEAENAKIAAKLKTETEQ